ncbi:MAG: DNA polymerase I, partial [Tannerellaceae bacterium]|nr:DNA polymerase I [Tannerellaceae bacterium]
PDLCRRQPADEVALRKLFTELEFHSFLDRFVKEPSKKKAPARQASLFDALPASADPVQPSSSVSAQQPDAAPDTEVAAPAPHIYRIADTPEKQAELATLLSAQERFSLFFLSQSEDVWQSAPEGIAFSLREYEAWFVPLPAEHDEAAAVLSRFASPLQDKHIEKVGHDVKFAILLLRRFGIRVDGPLFDVLIAHHLLHPELQHGRAYLVSTYLKHTPIRLNDQSLPNKTRLPFSQMPSQDLADYTAENADLLLRLRRFFVSTFDKDSAHVFEEVEMPLVYVLADMEFGGVALDTAALGESSLSLNSSLSLLQTTIFEMAGVSFNLNSSRQIALLLQDHFHLDVSAKTKTGLVSTGEAVLDQLRDRHPVIGKILEYRQVKKLLSTYVEALPRLVHPDTEKIHTSFNQAVVSTGRLSSTNPNLQNIPVRNELGREIRKAFTADDENCVFFSADYSQIELRILAHLSRDYTLVEAFHNKEDIHATTAAKIFHVPVDQVTPDMRRKAKSANFGIIYGISPFGLSRALGISREESSSLITNYFSSYPDVRKYLDQSLETARKNGYVETLLHRRTSVLNLNSANRAVRAAAERFVTNAPIQGSAADLIKLAMIAIYRRFEKKGLKARMIMQVHDELNFNVPCKELPTVRKIVVEEMENALPLEVPLVVDSGNGPNWLCAH